MNGCLLTPYLHEFPQARPLRRMYLASTLIA